MYLSFYKLNGKPFNISADPRFLWYGEKHREALATLTYGLIEENGYVVLTGDIGTGKTTLVNALIETLDENILVANINHPTLDAIEFLSLVAKTYDPSAKIADKTDFLVFFKSFLQRSYTQNKTALLVIDEAHRLSMELLEEIRLLSNMEQAGDKLINIFFIGQNELKPMLLSSECCALRQRITLFYDLQPLSEDETMSYMVHRLKVAGTEEQLFTSGAIHKIQDFTRGYPRLINIMCDRAMLTGYVKEQKKIDADIVSECAREISFLDPTTSKTETTESDELLIWESPSIDATSIETRGLESNAQEEPVDEKTPGRVRRFKNDTYQGIGSFMKRRRWRLVPAVLAAAIVVLTVVLDIDLNTGSDVKTDAPMQVDPTTYSEKASVPDYRAALAMSQQSTDNSKSVSETLSQDAPNVIPQTLKQEPPKKIVALKKENGPANPAPTVATSPSLGKTQSPEIKPKLQNKFSTAGSTESTSNKNSQVFRPTTMELATSALMQQNFKTAIELLEADQSRGTGKNLKAKQLYAKALVGRAVQVMKKSPSKAETMIHKAVEADPKNVNAHFNLGKIYTRTKEYTRAIDAYQNAIVLNPDLSDAIFNLGFIYAITGMYQEAERFFARVVWLRPTYLDKALFNLALVQEKMGKKQESMVNLKKAVAVRPDNRKVRAYLKQAESVAEKDL